MAPHFLLPQDYARLIFFPYVYDAIKGIQKSSQLLPKILFDEEGLRKIISKGLVTENIAYMLFVKANSYFTDFSVNNNEICVYSTAVYSFGDFPLLCHY